MSPLRLIILLVAAGAAIAAVFLVRSVQAPAKASAAAQIEVKHVEAPSRQVLVAKKDLVLGHFLVASDLAWQAWPENAQTKSFLTKKDASDALEKSVGAVAKIAMAEGEPITPAKIAHPGEGGWMSAIISPGMRAVAIEISAETAAGGFIQPNDHVDVLMTRDVDASENAAASGGQVLAKARAHVILQNVHLLAIDAIYSQPIKDAKDAKEGKTGEGGVLVGTRATLELAPQDAALIAAAQKGGRLTLALRSIADLQGADGATAIGKALRDGGGDQQVRIYRYGSAAIAPVPVPAPVKPD